MSQEDMDNEHIKITPDEAEQLRQDIEEAEKGLDEGKFFTIEEVRQMTDEMIAVKKRHIQQEPE